MLSPSAHSSLTLRAPEGRKAGGPLALCEGMKLPSLKNMAPQQNESLCLFSGVSGLGRPEAQIQIAPIELIWQETKSIAASGWGKKPEREPLRPQGLQDRFDLGICSNLLPRFLLDEVDSLWASGTKPARLSWRISNRSVGTPTRFHLTVSKPLGRPLFGRIDMDFRHLEDLDLKMPTGSWHAGLHVC